MKQRTDSYIFTADPMSVNDMQQIEIVRKTIAVANKRARASAKWSLTTPKIYRVCLKARLGKGNPAYAKYRGQWVQSIKLEDAQRIDVYVQERRS
jgi:hypothetical protein